MERRDFLKSISAGAGAMALPGSLCSSAAAGEPDGRPNVLWVLAEDMSPHMGCYGETTIETPNIDRLAREGARFTRAFITAPVCSPSRSAVITGMYQTSIGAHNHRSSRDEIKIGLPEHIKLIPQYFREAGYHTSNGGMRSNAFPEKIPWGKTDYNFAWDREAVYDAPDWSAREPGQPFFAQLQLHGGKNRRAKVPNPVDPADVKLPPYYPDHPVLREDWARYLNSVIQTDIELGQIMARLEDEGIADNTIVFFWTDHGISHIRDKQFLYEGGIHIPLIIRGPGVEPGTVRDDLVEHIDIPAASFRLADLPLPDHLQGRTLFGPDYRPRDSIFAARDRCDETVDRIRCVRTERYKYIRNFAWEHPHAQYNQYKDHKQIMITMRELYAEGTLNAEQARPFLPTRPAEELYDLQSDPHESSNLAESPEHQDALRKLRTRLQNWMREARDLGAIPEPELAELHAKYGSGHAILEDAANRKMVRRLGEIDALKLRGAEAIGGLVKATRDPAPAVRHAAAMALGNLGEAARPASGVLTSALTDDAASVRVAAARALCMMGEADQGLPVLRRELINMDSEIIRHYAAMALEDVGEAARPALDDLKAAREDPYDLVKRVIVRTVEILDGTYNPEAGARG